MTINRMLPSFDKSTNFPKKYLVNKIHGINEGTGTASAKPILQSVPTKQ
jgi:hypothetical protein